VATRSDGVKGFVKVIDYARALSAGSNFASALQLLTSEYLAERDLVLMCNDRGLSRVVTAIDHGELTISGKAMGGAVSYIVFELASGDVRGALSREADLDIVLKLDYLRHLITGVRQLHSVQVAHQDIKPSNLLVFEDAANRIGSGKIADLGRAYRPGFPTYHDDLDSPGDPNHAPLEQLYRYTYPDDTVRRFAADVYQVGSVAAFMFTGRTMNAWLASELAPEHHWAQFGDSYVEAIPYLQDAMGRVLAKMRDLPESELPDAMCNVIAYLCEPDAVRRGHPVTNRGLGRNYSLERVISNVDLIAKRAQVNKNRR
jgi:serine/threonine protein kinase